MRHNVNFSRVSQYLEKFADGKPVVLSVDNFPVSNPEFYKSNGFPSNEIGLLDRFSTTHMDKDMFDIIASRVQELSVNPDDGLTDAQKLKVLRPAWVQTASEVAAFEEHVYNVLSTFQSKESEPLSKTSTTSSTGGVVSEPPSGGNE